MTTSRRLPALVLALMLALTAAACSDDSSETATDVDTGEREATTTVATVGEATSAGTDTDGEPAAATGEPVPSAGCGTSTTGAVHQEKRTLADSDRWYLLTTPDAHDGETPLPLVLDIHGLAEGAEIHSGMTNYSALAEEEGFVVAFPHGTGEPVRWNVNLESDTNADLDYMHALLDTLEATLCIDTSRVYATGLSNGAMMTSALACSAADRFAAVAPIAGVADNAACDPSRPVPVMALHGTADPILGFNGGVGAIPGILGNADPSAPAPTAPTPDLQGEGYPAAVAAFAARNGCDGFTDTTLPESTDEIVHRAYDCPDGADVEFYIVVGGGHSWPGSEFSKGIGGIVGHTTFDVDASRLGWEFFERFQLPS